MRGCHRQRLAVQLFRALRVTQLQLCLSKICDVVGIRGIRQHCLLKLIRSCCVVPVFVIAHARRIRRVAIHCMTATSMQGHQSDKTKVQLQPEEAHGRSLSENSGKVRVLRKPETGTLKL